MRGKLGRIRLLETTQAFSPATFPELSQWLIGNGSPWGANTLPSAAGYFLRFAATTATIDTGGARSAGSTQADQILAHTHGPGSLAGTTDITGSHTHSVPNGGNATNRGQDAVTAVGTSPQTTGAAGDHSHTVTINAGLTGSAGSTENRVKNVAFHVDILASASLANSDVYGVNGVPYKFNTSIAAADPGTGFLSLNNATLASATVLYISETGATSEPLSAYLDTWDDSTSTIRGTFHFYKIGAVGTFAMFNVTGTVVDSGTYKTITIAAVASNGTFSNGDRIGVLFYRNGSPSDAVNLSNVGRTTQPFVSLTCVNGANTDLVLPEGTNFYITGPTAAFTISGLTQGTDGRTISLYNSVAFAMTITNDATSTAANRFLTLTGADITTTTQGAINLIYSSTAQRWINMGAQT